MMNKVLLLLLMVLVGSCSSNGSGDAGIGDGDGYGDLDLGDDFGLMVPEGTRACSQAVVSGGALQMQYLDADLKVIDTAAVTSYIVGW
jgi:hypothetical protein